MRVHPGQASGQRGGDGQVGVGISAGNAVFYPARHWRAVGHAQTGGAVVVTPLQVHRRLAAADIATKRIDKGRPQQQQVGPIGLQAGHELTQRGRLAAVVLAEDVAATGVEQALVQVHGAAGRSGDGLGHEDRVQAVLEGDFLGRVLEQKGLVGHRQRVAVQQVDLKLAGADLVQPGIGAYAQRGQRGGKFIPEGCESIAQVQAEGRLSHLRAARTWLRCL